MNDSSDALRTRFTGVLPENVAKLSKNANVNKFTLDPGEELDVDILAPCAIELYEDFVRRRKHSFSRSISKALRMDVRRKSEYYFRDFWLNKIYELLQNESVTEFLDFRAQAFVQIPIDFSERKDSSITRIIFKSKTAVVMHANSITGATMFQRSVKLTPQSAREKMLSRRAD